MYDADHLLSHIDSRIDASLVNNLRDEIEARHQPAGSQSPSNNSDNEQSKAVEMMSGWFEVDCLHSTLFLHSHLVARRILVPAG